MTPKSQGNYYTIYPMKITDDKGNDMNTTSIDEISTLVFKDEDYYSTAHVGSRITSDLDKPSNPIKEKIMNNQEVNTTTNETFEIAKKLISERNIGNNRFGIPDDSVNTNLISKNYSPMVIRKYSVTGWPLFVGIICDWDLSDLDKLVNDVKRACDQAGMITNNIQSLRNFTGILSETIEKYYNGKKEGVVEGIAIVLYADKLAIQNMALDMMTHFPCKMEFYEMLNVLPHI